MRTALLLAAAMLSGCAGAPGIAPPTRDAKLVQGPPIQDIVTPFDQALACLEGDIAPTIAFSVGAIVDHTGKEQLTEGGAGKFVTQGAGDIVQSALFKAGATVVNRRDPRVMINEVEWGIRNPRQIVPTNFYITGSINSLDFIPGAGVDIQVAGVGPRYRQHRILVGLDLSITDARTGRVVANVPLQKQIFASEAAIGVGRFFGETLISVDIGGKEREALHFALRQMLYLATFDLLTQLMAPQNYVDCRQAIDAAHGRVANTGTAEALAKLDVAASTTSGTPAAEAAAVPAPAESGTGGRTGAADGAGDSEETAAGDPPAGEKQSERYWEDEPRRQTTREMLPTLSE